MFFNPISFYRNLCNKKKPNEIIESLVDFDNCSIFLFRKIDIIPNDIDQYFINLIGHGYLINLRDPKPFVIRELSRYPYTEFIFLVRVLFLIPEQNILENTFVKESLCKYFVSREVLIINFHLSYLDWFLSDISDSVVKHITSIAAMKKKYEEQDKEKNNFHPISFISGTDILHSTRENLAAYMPFFDLMFELDPDIINIDFQLLSHYITFSNFEKIINYINGSDLLIHSSDSSDFIAFFEFSQINNVYVI